MIERRSVWKFPLHPGSNTIPARVRHIGVDPTGDQDGPTAWCEVLDGLPGSFGYINVRAYGTGHLIDDDYNNHVGSVVTPSGLVWHVYKEATDER